MIRGNRARPNPLTQTVTRGSVTWALARCLPGLCSSASVVFIVVQCCVAASGHSRTRAERARRLACPLTGAQRTRDAKRTGPGAPDPWPGVEAPAEAPGNSYPLPEN
jgi:hypothetical protein